MSSPARPPIDLTTIEVDQGFLPAPATKLVITQYLESSPDEPLWAWIIVGAFFDQHDNIVWSTELFAGLLEIDPDLSDGSSSASESSNSEAETAYSSDEARDSASDTAYHSEIDEPRDQNDQVAHWLQQQQQEAPPSPPPARLIQPEQVAYSNWHAQPTSWDPTRQGQVPGYWQASFNPSLRRWVHTWQSLC